MPYWEARKNSELEISVIAADYNSLNVMEYGEPILKLSKQTSKKLEEEPNSYMVTNYLPYHMHMSYKGEKNDFAADNS